MPQQDQSGKLGKSSSPIIDRVIQQNKNVQMPGQTTADAHNKKPVKP